jgi:hypothetical protein
VTDFDPRRFFARSRPWLWLALATPAIAQLGLLVVTIVTRYQYPYDLEWMEGGMLHHAHRIADGQGIYGPPSVDFIPYLYTPLYPGLLAVLGSMFGLSYQLGRAISIIALIGIAVTVVSIHLRATRGEAPATRAASLTGAALALGVFAAAYPWLEGWYDLVRADTLFLWMVTGGIALLHHTIRVGTRWHGYGRTTAAAAILGLAFFCKQTGIIFVAAGGVIVLATNWRRAPVYVAVTGAIGLGGVGLLDLATDGWFWVYVREVHAAHDFNWDRVWMALDMMLWQFPVVTITIGLGLVGVTTVAILKRRIVPAAETFLVWTFVYLVSIVVGQIGFGTEFAHKNAFMPAMLHGGIAAGCAIPAVLASASLLAAPHLRGRPLTLATQAPAVALAVALGVQLQQAWWQPSKWVPRAGDAERGDALVARLRQIEGEVWIPSHPWYAHLAGKDMHVHRMGIKDVTVRKPRKIAGLTEALDARRFAAIVLDNRDLHQYGELGALNRNYHEEDVLGGGERPRTVTGAIVSPESIWVPIGPARLPAGARVVFDFEDARWDGWTVTGTAWGPAPVRRALPKQAPVRHVGGQLFANSMHGGDAATGTLTSAEFEVTGPRLTVRLGGGAGDQTLRLEVLVGDSVVGKVIKDGPPSDRMQDVEIDVHQWIGQKVRLRAIDDATGAWGHMVFDEVWIHEE